MMTRKFIKRFWRWIKKNFDKAFYRSRGGQFVWLGSILIVVCGVFIGFCSSCGIGEWRVIELMLDPGSFVGSSRDGFGKAMLQFVVTLTGALAFTCLLINAFGNWLDRRIDNYKSGEVFYEFDDHILILGANGMLLNILKSLLDAEENKDRDIVILTTNTAEALRARIYSEIPRKKARNIYVVYGSRVSQEVLDKLDIFEIRTAYILGEDNEPVHDALNIRCFEMLRPMAQASERPIDCYMVMERLSSIQHFYYKAGSGSTEKLKLTVINALENAAQRVLVSRDYKDGLYYPALDRDGISANDEAGVHLIVVGMSQMGYAMATTAAHVCHFPNFQTKGVRTKITFIQKDIRQEMDFFVGRYNNLMSLSYYNYIDPEDPAKCVENLPDAKYMPPRSDKKGFLDIEWEFVDGSIETASIRQYISACAEKDGHSKHLTIAFCDSNAEANVAASLFLPSIVYDRHVPLLVYQPGSGQVLNSARDTSVYSSIYPFGMKADCYDLQYQRRLVCARRIQCLYRCADEGKKFEKMSDDIDLMDYWFDTQYAFQQSNLYAANSISFKLRSVANDGTRPLTNEEIAALSETEHNRWNVERLLLGFRAYPFAERETFRRLLCSGDKKAAERCKAELSQVKRQQFKHKDIAPYNELDEPTRNYDKAIIANIQSVVSDASAHL